MTARISETHDTPGKEKLFTWWIDRERGTVRISTEIMTEREYSLDEIRFILQLLREQFGDNWFALGNNASLIHSGKELPGLGTTLLRLRPNDMKHLQGCAYLGVILEECGFLKWNGKGSPVGWRLTGKEYDRQVFTDLSTDPY